MSLRRTVILLGASLWASTLGCGDSPKPAKKAPAKDSAAAATAQAAPQKSRKANKAEDEAQDLPPRVELPIDFNDAARTRDPFLSFGHEFAEEAKKRVKSQREVVLDQYGLDELKLAGLVTGIRPVRAMLVDPQKKGTVVHEGQFIGRSEVVQGGTTGADYEVNWRIDRIRDTDIVLVREDPSNRDVPTATRVISLRPDDETALATR
jgi:type IV pilus assembly protein PilP